MFEAFTITLLQAIQTVEGSVRFRGLVGMRTLINQRNAGTPNIKAQIGRNGCGAEKAEL